MNSAGLLLAETTLADTGYRPSGVPCFVRAREAAQYASTVGQAVKRLLTDSNGAYSNEWLIGDSSGAIASLEMGFKVHDLHVTRNGFFGSSNYDWGANTRKEEGTIADSPNPANDDYARYVRWGQLHSPVRPARSTPRSARRWKPTPSTRTSIRSAPTSAPSAARPRTAPPACPTRSDYEGGAYDAKVCTESMALDGMQMWARWGHPNGDPFSATAFLQAFPKWGKEYGPLAVFGLETFSAQTPNPWVLIGK